MKRTFLGWDVPALPAAARHLLDHYASGDEARMDGAVVALPGGRAGRRLKEVLVAEAGERGVRLVPPRIVTVGAVPEMLFEPRRRPAPTAVARLTWAAALRDTPAERLETVFARRPEGDALHEWSALAREIGRLHRDVARGGHRFGDVAGRCRAAAAAGHVTWDDADRWEVLAEVQREYESRLDGMELADRELARIAALRAGDLAADADVWLVAVPELPGVVGDALRAVGHRVHALVHAPADRADAFDELGCVVPAAWTGADVPLDESRLAVRDRPDHQADEVARVLAGLGGAYAPDEIVVGAPDAGVVPWVAERLAAAGVPVRDAAGESVRRTGPYRLLAAVADFLDGHRWDAFAGLARHPDVARWVGSSGRDELSDATGYLEPLDRWYGRHLPSRLPPRGRGRIAGAASRHGRPTAALVELLRDDLLAELAEPGARRPLARWTEPVLELLARVYRVRGLAADRPTDRRVARALEILAGAAHAFDELPHALDEPCAPATAVRLLLEEAAGQSVPADPERAAVEILGWLELHLDDAPVAVVTGVNEPWLPASVRADPFLPDRLRARLGLEDDRLRYARDAYRLTAMAHSTPELRLVTGRRSASGDPLRPSRLLFAADEETVARRVRRFYDPEWSDDPDTRETREAPESAPDGAGDPGPPPEPGPLDHESSFHLPPEPEIHPPEPVTSLRATDFRSLLQDPYGFALRSWRGCDPLDDAAREMDGMIFGDLAHRVLERFGRDAATVHLQDEAAVARALDELLDDEVRRRFGSGARHARVAVRLQVEQLRARLRRFASWHVGHVADGWRVVGVECSTPDGGVPLDVDGTPVGIRARIDRVDHHPERGAWAVFDYKTGDRGLSPHDTHRTNYGKDWCDLQLPLYRWLLPRVTDEDGAPLFPGTDDADVRVGYLLLPRELDAVGPALADWGEAELADALETGRDVVRRIREHPFRFDETVSARWPDPPTEALLGRGLLAAGTAGEEET